MPIHESVHIYICISCIAPLDYILWTQRVRRCGRGPVEDGDMNWGANREKPKTHGDQNGPA